MVSPKQIEKFVLNMTGTRNYQGPEAVKRIKRFGLDESKHGDIFDCDARADIAVREARKAGYMARQAIQRRDGKVAHRYVVLMDAKGNEFPILKV